MKPVKKPVNPVAKTRLLGLCCYALLLFFTIDNLQSEPSPPSQVSITSNLPNETAVFGAGCFWCLEAIYKQQPGVVKVTSGYAGDVIPNPTYEQVSSGKTRYAEVIKVEYNPNQTSYQKLLDLFWKTHDPTDPRGVWPDFGPQYRSIILYGSAHQQQIAEQSKIAEEKRLGKPITTEVTQLKQFYPAENYHQDYVKNHPNDPYVRQITIPKLKKLGLQPPP